jgi:ketosteroid isomerase-like protein
MSARATIDQYFDALTAGDCERLLATISTSDGFIKIGTEAGEVVSGGSNASEYYSQHVTSTRDFTIETVRLDVEERPEIAWFFTEQVWRVTWQGTPETLAMRITGVLESEDSGWKFIQIHASLGTHQSD